MSRLNHFYAYSVPKYKLADFSHSVQKQLRKLPVQVLQSIAEKICQLEENPYLTGCRKLAPPLLGYFRVRVSDYRIIYTVNTTTKTLEILRIKHRSDVYRV